MNNKYAIKMIVNIYNFVTVIVRTPRLLGIKAMPYVA